MKLVWCSWKDIKHPLAGGAEKVTHNILKRLAADGHEVILLTSRPDGASTKDTIDGYAVVRSGNRYSVYWQTRKYYKKHLRGWADVVIDEINTIPFFARAYSGTPTYVFIHQLARKVWFYQMVWPLSWVGYILEPMYLKQLKDSQVFTVSDSTKNELISLGFAAQNIRLVHEGTDLKPLDKLSSVKKYAKPTLLSLGAVRPMKRTADIVLGFNQAKKSLPSLKLVIAGDTSDPYANKVRELINASPYKADISMLGAVSHQQKEELMQRSHVQAVTSVKEGWGLTVTEANSQGTPVVAYDVDGLRDSVKNNRTGIVTAENPEALGNGIAELLTDLQRYETFRHNAWEDSKQYTFDACYADFLDILHDFSSSRQQ